MAILTFSFDTGNVPPSRIVDAFAAHYGYKATLPDGSANTETKTTFARRMLRQHIVDIVRGAEQAAAVDNASKSVQEITLKIVDSGG
jgi:hypothetical protein